MAVVPVPESSEPHHVAQSQPYFAQLTDPRRETRNKLHSLQDIAMITLCATLCGYDDWVSIEDFAHENEAGLWEFPPLANGIPSHDTLSDVIGRIERKAFSEAFACWMQDSLPELDTRHIALDGKALRGSRQDCCFQTVLIAMLSRY